MFIKTPHKSRKITVGGFSHDYCGITVGERGLAMTRSEMNEKLLAALDKELAACGLPKSEEEKGKAVMRAIITGRMTRAVKAMGETDAVAAGLGSILAAGIRTRVKSVKNEREFNLALDKMRGLRYKLRPVLSLLLAQAANALPQKPRGPRPKLTGEEQRAICSTIDTLRNNGTTLQYAIEITAREHKVNPRLARKAWETKGRCPKYLSFGSARPDDGGRAPQSRT